MTLKAMSQDEIIQSLKNVPQWSELSGSIQRTYQFKNFVAAMIFVNKVAEYAEQVQHHPDILIRWNKVTLSVNTHDCEGGCGISIKDFDLATSADRLA